MPTLQEIIERRKKEKLKIKVPLISQISTSTPEEPPTPIVKNVEAETDIKRDNKRKLKSELRKLVESLAQGHKKYQEYGFGLIGEAKARIHEIIDLL